MNNWTEVMPGFWLPRTWTWDRVRWPDYTDPEYIRWLEEAPDFANMLKLRGLGQPTRQQWGAWIGAFQNDKPIATFNEWLAAVTDRLYDAARYKFLVPAWKRKLTELLTEIDDIEDQLSTLLWVAETVSRKWIPIPKGLLSTAQRATTALDCAGKVLGGVIPGRTAKAGYVECLAAIKEGKRQHREAKAGLIAWFQENWGRLLEAAQATGTWFDVGIVLGPIWAWIDEGVFGVIKQTPQISNVTAEVLFPGTGAAVEAAARDLVQRLDDAWDSTWGSGETIEYDELPEWATYN